MTFLLNNSKNYKYTIVVWRRWRRLRRYSVSGYVVSCECAFYIRVFMCMRAFGVLLLLLDSDLLYLCFATKNSCFSHTNRTNFVFIYKWSLWFSLLFKQASIGQDSPKPTDVFVFARRSVGIRINGQAKKFAHAVKILNGNEPERSEKKT